MKKKLLSMLLVLAMLCSLVPAVFATGTPVATQTLTLIETKTGDAPDYTTVELSQSAANKITITAKFSAGAMTADFTKWLIGDRLADVDGTGEQDFNAYDDPSDESSPKTTSGFDHKTASASTGGATLDASSTEEVLVTDATIQKGEYGFLMSTKNKAKFGYAEFAIGDDGLLVLPKGPVKLVPGTDGSLPSGVTSPVQVTVGTYTGTEAINAAVNVTPTKANNNFVGWTNTGATATNTTDVLTVTESPASGSEPELTAMWSPKTAPAAGDFEVTGSYVYTGEAQKPTVAVKDTVTGMGAITVKDSSKQTNAGTYSVDISVAEATYASGDVTLANAWTIAPAKPTFTFAGKDADTPIAEGTLLKDIVVTVKGVGAEVLGAGTHVWKDKDGNTLDADTTAVAPETEYIYTYTPDATESNYEANSGKYVLGQTKANVTFKVQGSGKLVDTDKTEKAEIVVELDKDAKITAPATVDGLNTKFYGWYKGDVKVEDMSKETATADVTYTAVFKTYHAHYMQGTGTTVKTFEPEKPMTRAQAAVMLANLNGFDPDADYKDAGYTDVSAETIPWAYKQINFVTQEGFMNGKGYISASNKNGFAPNEPITRQEMATILGRSNGIAEVTTGDTFDDIDKAASWAKGFLTAMKQQNLIEGRDGKNFDPTANLKRAEAAKMVNYAQGRKPDTEKMDKKDLIFKDVEGMADWAVYNVIEATVDHFEEAFH